eukprot:TRINITY_DN7899_c0_g1_i1.p1 TRINITY_DN7899_c0_g1~~TRINITY_DN7899_c0_g1_i1.p1  ORF type:complete len:210 (+),score=57.71 TRINITY_DN7899_c0_g1_i1:95-631(+)
MQSGYTNNLFLQSCTQVGAAETATKWRLVHCDGEVRVLRGDTSVVSGELYEVSDETLQTFDTMEKVGGDKPKALREKVQVSASGKTSEAWMYVSLLPAEEAEEWDTVDSGRVQDVVAPDAEEDADEGGAAAAAGLAMMLGLPPPTPADDDDEEEEEDEEEEGQNGGEDEPCNKRSRQA